MNPLNILLSSAGRRVALMECLREGLYRAGVPGRVIAADAEVSAAAFHLADDACRVPRCDDQGFLRSVIEISSQHSIGLIVPTIDPELPVYAEARDTLAGQGVTAAVSRATTIAISGDKAMTHAWLCAEGFPTVGQAYPAEVLAGAGCWELPVIVKPAEGSASAGVRIVDSLDELRALARRRSDLVVESIAPGDEYTVNVYVNRLGQCVCEIPHRRLQVRGGEVSKAVTRKHRPLMELSRAVAERLPGAWGPLNVQCFLAPDGEIRIIEINSRFGGGYPLADRAGGRFAEWLIRETYGLPIPDRVEDWRDDLAMLRYDEAVFLPGSEVNNELHETALYSV